MRTYRYTIAYVYGSYSGEETVTLTEEQIEQGVSPIDRMWLRLRQYMTLGMASKSARIIDTEDLGDDEEDTE